MKKEKWILYDEDHSFIEVLGSENEVKDRFLELIEDNEEVGGMKIARILEEYYVDIQLKKTNEHKSRSIQPKSRNNNTLD